MRKIAYVLFVMVIICMACGPALALTVGFSPSSKTVNIYGTFAIDVLITKSANEIVSAFDLDVAYDPLIITATKVTFGSSLGGPDYSFADYNLTSGLIDFAEVSLLSDSDLLTSQLDTFILATLFFKADAQGTSLLALVNFDSGNDMKGANNAVLSPECDQGEVTVKGSAAVPEPSTMLLLGAGLAVIWGYRRKFSS